MKLEILVFTMKTYKFMWRENSYIPKTMMCLSFQFQKHLSLGRGNDFT